MALQIKWIIAVVLLTLCTACTSVNTKKTETAVENSNEAALPIEEKAFVNAVENVDKKTIVAQLGEPAKAEDVKIRGSNRIVASIWHYHNINTNENGVYYETTELDFIDNKVVQVVFLNNDGSGEVTNESHANELPK